MNVDISRIDIRVGKILSFGILHLRGGVQCDCSIENHPDADSLYVEQIDLGEATGKAMGAHRQALLRSQARAR